MNEYFSEYADRPETMEALKQLAKHLKLTSQVPIKHHQALDQASVVAGYSNFTEAHRVLALGKRSRRQQVRGAEWSRAPIVSVPVPGTTERRECKSPVRIEVKQARRKLKGPDATVVGVNTDRPSRAILRLVVNRSAETHRLDVPPADSAG